MKIFLMILVITINTVESFNPQIVVLEKSEYHFDLKHQISLSVLGANNTSASTFTASFPVKYLKGDQLIEYWRTEYESENKWLVVIDTSTDFCPMGLLQSHALSYVTTAMTTCSRLPNDFRELISNVRTVSFEYKNFLSDLEIYTNASTDSLALMFDESGRAHQHQRHLSSKKILFQIDIPIQSCNISNELKNLTAKTEVKVVFVSATSSCIEIMLQEAYRLDMLRGRYRWVTFATDGKLPHCDICQEANVILLVDPEQSHNIINVDSEEKLVRLVDSVLKVMVQKIQSDPSIDCPLDCGAVCGQCRQLFKDSLLEMGTENGFGVYINKDGVTQEPVVVDIHRFNNRCEKIGTWIPGIGIESDEQIFVIKDSMVVLRVAVVVEPPFVFRNTSGQEVMYEGYSIDVMNDVAERVGFTYTIRECDGGVYGNLDSDQRWTGCVGNILKGDADIIVGAMTVTADRETVVDYTLPYYDFAGIQILMRKQKQQVNIFYFADVFSNAAWLCLGGVIALTSILLLLFDKYSPGPGFSKNVEKREEFKFNLHESIWFVVGSITMAGGGDPPRSFSARLLVAGFWFFSVIMMSTFTANLAAFLTVSRLGVTVSSLDDLAEQSDIKYSVVAESSVANYFERMAAIEENFYSMWKEMSLGTAENGNSSFAVWDYPLGDKYVTIWKSIRKTGFIKTSDAAIDKVLSENFALLTDSPIIKYITSRNCELTAIGDQFSVRPYAFALKEKSVYTKKISAAILDLQQDRKLETYKRKWWDDGKVSCPEDTSNQGLDLQSLTGSFLVVVMGIVSGVIVLGIELLWIKAKVTKKSNVLQVKPVQPTVVKPPDQQKQDQVNK